MLPSHEVHRALKLILYVLAALFSIECSVAVFARLYHLPYPYTTLLYNPTVRFSDWVRVVTQGEALCEANLMRRQDIGFPFHYPLPAFYPFVLFAKLFHQPVSAYIVFPLSSGQVPPPSSL